MTLGLQGFVNTWGSAFYASESGADATAIGQGGNQIFAAVPRAVQAMWTGALMETVTQVASGPLYWVAQFFRIAFNPFVGFPLSIVSCTVKENFYESSLSLTAPETTQYYTITHAAPQPIQGTITLNVGGIDRHFMIGKDLQSWVDNTIEKSDGKRYWIYGSFTERPSYSSNTIYSNGKWFHTSREPAEKTCIWQTINGKERCFELEKEVEKPIEGTVAIDGINYYIKRISEQAPNCVTIRSQEQTFFYHTGEEIDSPQEGSSTFIINGKEKHFASAKYVQEEFVGFSGWINRATKYVTGYSLLPERLSKSTANALGYLNRHSPDIIRVATLVSGVVFVYFGHIAMAAGVISVLTYEYLNNDLGVVPQKISLFMEKWMPTISMVGLLIVGSSLTKITAALTLLLTIPSVQLFIHHKVANVARQALFAIGEPLLSWFSGKKQMPREIDQLKNHPKLEEFDAPLVQKKDLNAKEIREILKSRFDKTEKFWEGYEINPASLTKNVDPLPELEKNTNFNLLLDLWDKRKDKWTDATFYKRIFNRLADDDRFIEFLQEKFPHAERLQFQYDYNDLKTTQEDQFIAFKKKINGEIEGYIEKLIQDGKEKKTKEQFAANWAREQLQHFIRKLESRGTIEGTRADLRDAMENTSKIIPFLLKSDVNQVELEDAVLKLAVEAGNYCTLALNRASREVLQGFSYPLLKQSEAHLPPNQRFEKEFLRVYQKSRDHAIQSVLNTVVVAAEKAPRFKRIIEDVHFYRAFSNSLKRNFYPMTEEEMNNFSIIDLLFSETFYLPIRVFLQKAFQGKINDEMIRLGTDSENIRKNRILDCLREWVQHNASLTNEEKQEFLDGDLAEENVADSDMHPKWHLLMLVMLGIVRKPQNKLPAAL